jgi:Methyltransferase domain
MTIQQMTTRHATATTRTRVLQGHRRHDVTNLLAGRSNIGVELGVAEGVFSARMVASGKFSAFFGVDMYADSHDTAQYKRALRAVGLLQPYKLLRMRFEEAIDLFDDASLDFVYVDGYAHGGEEGGETLFSWFRKVKVGGVIAGDDYSPAWPLVVEAVDEFARQLDAELLLTDVLEPENAYCRYPTWAIVKTADRPLNAPLEMIERGKRVNRHIARQQDGGVIRRVARDWLPPAALRMVKRLRK